MCFGAVGYVSAAHGDASLLQVAKVFLLDVGVVQDAYRSYP